MENIKAEEVNSTAIAISTTAVFSRNSTLIRAKRQWGGCGFGGCGSGFPNCGANGCSLGCNGAGCGGGGYGGCGCCSRGCGQMCCQNRQPRPCVNCGSAYRCCPCCMPTCSRACVRGGGCYCDYDYGTGWGRKKRHALDFDRSNSSTEFIED
uniref:Uncharacterized protein n=1 Tax=Panagrolaimus sp. PS1159 TaxID=55785 RepID=A0AC35GBF5_9BILA